MRIQPNRVQTTTGYGVRQGRSAHTAELAPVGQAPIELPIAAVEQLQRSYEALGGVTSHSNAANSGAADGGQTLRDLQANLNRSLFDSSPLVVTHREARAAFQALMKTPPGTLSTVIRDLPDPMLDRLLTKLADAEPFALDGGLSPLVALASKLTLELDPAVGKSLLGRLGDEGKRRLLEGALGMPSGAMLARLRDVVGEDGWKGLVLGSCDDALMGRGLLDGRYFDDNRTADFQTKYAAALDGNLPPPANIDDVVFVGGPGLFGDQLPGYLEPNMRALQEWGVDKDNTVKLDYNTAASPQDNADAIYTQLKALHDDGKRIVVYGHSKFGRDMLEAFHRHPDLKDMVDGTVLMQPALTAQIARDLARPEMQSVLDPVLQLVGGNRAAFNGMSTPFEDLPHWPADVPTMVMASSTESPSALLRTVADHYYECHYNVAGDGAVALQDQVSIDNASVVTLPGLADHAQPGLKFADLCEHFAVQVEAGAPDDVVDGMLQRLKAMAPGPIVDGVIAAFKKAHNTPQERARCAAQLRAVGPALDRVSHVAHRKAGHDLVDNEAMTQALMSQLFEKMAEQTPTSGS